MYDIDISEATTNRDGIFDEMIEWLCSNIGPQISEERIPAAAFMGNFHRKYIIEGTGWRYVYHVVRVPINANDFDDKRFKYVGTKAGGSAMYVSKRVFIEDAIRAVEFKLKW
jgi:hypothetical protein